MNLLVGVASATLIAFCSCSSPEKDYLEDPANTNLPEIEKIVPTEAEEGIQMTEDVIEIVESIGDVIKENKSYKDSVYEATRSNKWVIKVGDYAVDEKYLKDDYMEIHELGTVMSFKNNSDNYFLFFEETGNEFELTEKLEDYKVKLNKTKLSLEVVDLNSFCSRKESLVIISPITIGKRKEKYKIKCYACE